MKRAIAVLAIVSAAALTGCASSPPGPVQPMSSPSAPGVLVLDNSIAPWLDVAGGHQVYTYNAAGLLEYSTVVRNRGSQPMTLSYTVYCLDDAGTPVEEQAPQRFFIDPSSEKALVFSATSRQARKMRVQIRPAR